MFNHKVKLDCFLLFMVSVIPWEKQAVLFYCKLCVFKVKCCLYLFENFSKLSMYLASHCSHYYQMLTFTVKGIKKHFIQQHPCLCPEIECCWGVRGSHPCMFPTCSKTHPICRRIVANLPTTPHTRTHPRQHTHITEACIHQVKVPPDKEHKAQRWCSDRCSCHILSISPPPE